MTDNYSSKNIILHSKTHENLQFLHFCEPFLNEKVQDEKSLFPKSMLRLFAALINYVKKQEQESQVRTSLHQPT